MCLLRSLAIASALAASLLMGCSKDDPTGPGQPTPDAGQPAIDTDGGSLPLPGMTGVVITPATAELVTDGVTPAVQSFAIEATLSDGTREDITGRAALRLSDRELGSLSGGVLTSGLVGASGTLEASLGGFRAEATIRVRVVRDVIVPPTGGQAEVPPSPGSIFERAPEDPSWAPRLVYPNDGALLPVNLGSVEIHYKPARAESTLFELTLTSPLAVLTLYTRCERLSDGCLYAPDASVWAAIAETNRGRDPITIRMRATDDAGTAVGVSSELRVSFSAVPVLGGLYYWTTSNGSGIMRVDFGAGQAPERFFPFEGTGCFGCHALSRNGQRMTLTQNGIGDGRLTIIDVGGRRIISPFMNERREQFQSWNPTSDAFAGIFGDGNPVDTNIRIRDGDTGNILETIAIGTEPSHPDWSPRGDRIAFTLVTRHSSSQRPGRGGISWVERAGAGWGAPQELVPPEDGFNRYYPAYGPSAEVVVFNESICPGGVVYTNECDGDADRPAKLWAISANGGARIHLTRADGPGVEDEGQTDLSNTFPKWAPFTDPRLRGGGSERVMWVTFSSRRQYGLRSPSGTNQLIWMAAIDPDAILAGQDGSFPAFALPFQDISTSNHIAQWTTRIVPPDPQPGTDGGIDPGGDGGACVDLGGPCDPNADACCSGTACLENGPGIYLCRPDF